MSPPDVTIHKGRMTVHTQLNVTLWWLTQVRCSKGGWEALHPPCQDVGGMHPPLTPLWVPSSLVVCLACGPFCDACELNGIGKCDVDRCNSTGLSTGVIYSNETHSCIRECHMHTVIYVIRREIVVSSSSSSSSSSLSSSLLLLGPIIITIFIIMQISTVKFKITHSPRWPRRISRIELWQCGLL